MATSGQYAFAPALVDIVLDAFDRIDVRPSAITPDHMFSARRALNQLQSRWTNRAVNLWLVEDVTTPIVNGEQIYQCAAGTAAVLNVYVRNFQMSGVVDIAVAMATVDTTTAVTVTWADHGLVADVWISIPVPVSIGGVIVQGFYQVVSVPSTSTFTLTAASAATSTASGGAVPSYATVAADATVTITLADHGYVAGEYWTVHVTTEVGGLALLGQYLITATTTNTLTFEAASVAGSTDSESENGGEMQIAAADYQALPQDYVLSPLSHDEWAELPSKSSTSATQTSYWFNRQINPSLYIWPLPDITSPTELHYVRMRQMQDANPQNTETPDIPYRAEEAFCAELAAQLAVKWNPAKYQILNAIAKEAWAEFAQEDRDRVALKFQPDLSAYYT